MRDEIWYREELIALRCLVEDQIRRSDPANFAHMSALGGLHMKIEKQLASAPSARTQEGAA